MSRNGEGSGTSAQTTVIRERIWLRNDIFRLGLWFATETYGPVDGVIGEASIGRGIGIELGGYNIFFNYRIGAGSKLQVPAPIHFLTLKQQLGSTTARDIS